MARGVKLLLSAGRTRALSGEGLPVEVLVRNGATTPIVLSVGPANPIVFELRATPDGPVAATRSSLMALREAIAGRSKRLPANTEEVVGPGDTVTFEENPAAGSSKPIPAGRYSLAARWEIDGTSVLSDAVELVVEPPSAGHLAALFCPFTGRRSTTTVTVRASTSARRTASAPTRPCSGHAPRYPRSEAWCWPSTSSRSCRDGGSAG